MKKFLRSGFLLIVGCFAPGLGARAQTVLYATDFPDDQGWTFQCSAPCCCLAWWAVDAMPSSVLGTPSWRSAPYSLNYNNGVNYYLGITLGYANSPPIDLSMATDSVELEFWCNREIEPGMGCGPWEALMLRVSNDGFQTQLLEACFSPVQCGPDGQWHPHSIPLDPSWGVVQLRFVFAADGVFNDGAGWFIDDLAVIGECASTVGYCTPKLNSQGCSPTIFTTGTPSLSGAGTAFRIWAGSVLNQKVGLMLWSRTPASTPFGGGTLCVAAPITRTAAQNSGGTSLPAQDCSGTYVLQFTPAMMSQAGLLVGDDVYSQYWSRDNGFPPPDNVGLTAGVHWEVCP